MPKGVEQMDKHQVRTITHGCIHPRCRKALSTSRIFLRSQMAPLQHLSPMPKGVEHMRIFFGGKRVMPVHSSPMPKGVEHM